MENVEVSAFFSKPKTNSDAIVSKDASSKKSPRKVVPAKSYEEISDDSGDDFEPELLEVPEAKTTRSTRSTNKKEHVVLSVEDDDDDISMAKQIPSKFKNDLDDLMDEDDDFEVLEATPVKPAKSSAKKPPAKSVSKVQAHPVKAAPKPVSKSATSVPPSGSASSRNGLTSDDVLKRIPDAILPDVDPSKKFNFHALKAAQASAPQSSGDVEIPTARENCLAGLTFVFTGILPRLPRDQAQDLVKKYGGKVTTAPSSKTSCVVLGGDAGPSKIQKIQKLGIKTIDEEGFLQLLRDMPADGGSGENAQKAVLKQKQEEQKIETAAKQMAKEISTKYKSVEGGETQQLWTTKYAPSELSHICGNKGQVEKLGRWLGNWKRNAKLGFKSPGADGSGIYRAVIISGPPGIGKTTTAHLVAKLQGFDVVESNASDTRSKNMLIEKVSGSIKNTSLNGYFGHPSSPNVESSKKNLCLVMDEVDGMSGGDRGGVGQMAALCRTTNVPIILICNERSLPKMRPFDKVAYDMQFRRPDASALRVRIMGIANKEGIRITPTVVDQLVSSSGSDMRQIINMLYTYSRTHKKMDFETSKEFGKAFEKTITLKTFDIASKLLSGGTFNPNSGISLDDKIRYYFDDHDFTPLMVQENYLNTHPASVEKGKFSTHLEAVVAAAEAISDGDLVDKKIHGSQPQWSLMPFHGVMSSVLPCSYIAGQGRGRYNFTSYLGQNSKTNKYNRLLQEIQSHARLKISGDRKEVRLQYLPLLGFKLINPLLTEQDAGIDEVITVMDEYFLTKEDWDVIMELGVGSLSYEPKAKGLPTAVKSAFTRTYNKESHPVPFMKSASMFSAKATSAAVPTEVPDLEETIGEETAAPEEDAAGDEDEDADLTKDKYIKVSKPKAPAKRGAKKSATTSGTKTKAKTTARGKGRASTK